MNTKLFEVRDKMTFIPVLAVRVNVSGLGGSELYLVRRCGFSQSDDPPFVILCRLAAEGIDRNATYDPMAWYACGNRTLSIAHRYIIRHWEELESGAVIDVEFVLGETKEPKRSERETV